MRKERNLEKSKIQQSILMSKQEEAKHYKMKIAQEIVRKESQNEYVERINAERKERIRFEEQMVRQKAEEVRRKKFADARADIKRQIEEE